jgi:hypothetical protein
MSFQRRRAKKIVSETKLHSFECLAIVRAKYVREVLNARWYRVAAYELLPLGSCG